MEKKEKKKKMYQRDGDPIVIDNIKYYFYKMQYYNRKGELRTRKKTMQYTIKNTSGKCRQKINQQSKANT